MARSIDNRLDFLSPVKLIPGLGAKRTAALNNSGIETIGDLLYHFPLRYIDRATIIPLVNLYIHQNKQATIIGTITKTRVEQGRKPRLRIQITDDTGSLEALWFHGVAFLRKTLRTGMRVLCTGVVKTSGAYQVASPIASLQMIHPSLENLLENKLVPLYPYLPHYPITAAMQQVYFGQKALFKAIVWALDNLTHYPQVLPQVLEDKKHFMPLSQCLREIHVPSDLVNLKSFKNRIAFEELYKLAVSLHWSKRTFALPGRSMDAAGHLDAFLKTLPFELTPEQNRALSILLDDAKSTRRMHRLLQGDVGSGKTVVAFCACLPALHEGMQVAWLVPTEILAAQAFSLLSTWCKNFNVSIDFLTSAVPADKKRAILRGLHNNSLQFIVGTHALLQQTVVFKKLGMIVIDEQHKFGAQQRLTLQEKDPCADFLLMSATPIPQTLAKTLYGDLDIVSIKGHPSGRIPVSTHHVPSQKRAAMETFILGEILHKNAQVFYVVPRIDTSESSDSSVKDASSVFEALSRGVFSEVPCAMVHGQTEAIDRLRIMEDFAKGTLKLIVATTIVEVGIDVPGATIMVIENSERFGLSQLHQLRGRVGRSMKKSFCFLLSNETTNPESHKRIDYFCNHTDGFEIAEMDLRLRGPGEVAGVMQSGWDDLKMADIVADAQTFQEIMEFLASRPLKS